MSSLPLARWAWRAHCRRGKPTEEVAHSDTFLRLSGAWNALGTGRPRLVLTASGPLRNPRKCDNRPECTQARLRQVSATERNSSGRQGTRRTSGKRPRYRDRRGKQEKGHSILISFKVQLSHSRTQPPIRRPAAVDSGCL